MFNSKLILNSINEGPSTSIAFFKVGTISSIFSIVKHFKPKLYPYLAKLGLTKFVA